MSNYASILGDPEQAVYYISAPDKPIYKFVAHCTSTRCTGGEMRVIKDVSRKASTCPDCSHYLVWKRTKIG